jgi:hypothetical protein
VLHKGLGQIDDARRRGRAAPTLRSLMLEDWLMLQPGAGTTSIGWGILNKTDDRTTWDPGDDGGGRKALAHGGGVALYPAPLSSSSTILQTCQQVGGAAPVSPGAVRTVKALLAGI